MVDALGILRFRELSGLICHQGTVYEATAYAVPFLAAIASGDVEHLLRRQLTFLLGLIAIGSSYATENGSRAGAYGEGVDLLIREAFKCSAPRLAAVIMLAPDLAEIAHAINAIAAAPNRTTHAALRAALDGDDKDDDAPIES